jgi:ribosome maturation factor RimP
MAKKSIAADMADLLLPVVTAEGFELFDVVFVKEGANWYLRLFVDKPSGVSINDCEQVSRAVEKVLDEKDPIEQSYILEVSSPGMDRPLKKDADYTRFQGSLVDVRLYKPFKGRKEYRGQLRGLENGQIVIVDETGAELRFAQADTAVCRLAVVL